MYENDTDKEYYTEDFTVHEDVNWIYLITEDDKIFIKYKMNLYKALDDV